MAKITKKEVEHVSRLARLELSDEEKETFTKQLNNILTYVEKLNELDTKDVEPTSHVLQIQNIFKEDEIRESLPRERALSNAPDRTDEFYRVPKIIE
ncbi:MAG: Asp-tRNA(Asn)/Glu-tRNA(Gln) amidotransferase subunit GatC [Nitrospirota bacterium]